MDASKDSFDLGNWIQLAQGLNNEIGGGEPCNGQHSQMEHDFAWVGWSPLFSECEDQ